MKKAIPFLSLLLLLCGDAFCQEPSFYDLSFAADSITVPFAPAGKNYVFVRSKRGTSGVNTTPGGDSAASLPISKIILVYTEMSPDDIANREEYNQERWENLIMTYPQLFQAKTIYKNVCQCNANGDGEAFKAAQGFYIFYTPAAAPPKPAEVKAPEKKEEPKAEEKKKEEPKKEQPAAAKKEEPAPAKKEEPAAASTPRNNPPPTEPAKEEEVKPAQKTPVTYNDSEGEEGASEAPKKGAAANKPRRSKDKKACRPACYGYGDEDLNAYFKDNLTFTKKQRKKAKKWVADVRISLHFDGSIKKVMVTGSNTDFNKLVEETVKNMNKWNFAVKNGVAVKSEVRFRLKWDKEWKCMKPYDVMVNPKPMPKCNKCMTDAEIFGS